MFVVLYNFRYYLDIYLFAGVFVLIQERTPKEASVGLLVPIAYARLMPEHSSPIRIHYILAVKRVLKYLGSEVTSLNPDIKCQLMPPSSSNIFDQDL